MLVVFWGGGRGRRIAARLDQLDRRFDTVQNNLEESQRQLTLFERATCSMCGRRRRHKDTGNDIPMAPVAPATTAATVPAGAAGRPASTASKSPASSGAPAASAPMRRIVNDEREDEMAANLDVVGDILADLRLQSQQMGETLDAQNERLAQLKGKADTNLGLVANVNKRTTALL